MVKNPTKKELNANVASYKLANPVWLGTIHERMKLVMQSLREASHDRVGYMRDDPAWFNLWEHIHDLEVEVRLHDSGPSRGKMEVIK